MLRECEMCSYNHPESRNKQINKHSYVNVDNQIRIALPHSHLKGGVRVIYYLNVDKSHSPM